MDDNAWPHRTADVKQPLESEDITRMDWLAFPPDLNPIEHTCGNRASRCVGHLEARLHRQESTQQLTQILIEERALLPQELLNNLVLSMERRCEATIAVKGKGIPHTKKHQLVVVLLLGQTNHV
ncbi:transposable element Tcb2 transposase [Trichonephila clavipes]|nr:transposable element Tcb2 transposase [Trichonephila clavipes]